MYDLKRRKSRPIEKGRVYVKKSLETSDYKAFRAYRVCEARHTKSVSSVTDQAEMIYENIREALALNLMYMSR